MQGFCTVREECRPLLPNQPGLLHLCIHLPEHQCSAQLCMAFPTATHFILTLNVHSCVQHVDANIQCVYMHNRIQI